MFSMETRKRKKGKRKIEAAIKEPGENAALIVGRIKRKGKPHGTQDQNTSSDRTDITPRD